MKTSKILKNRHMSKTPQVRKTLAYIGENLKMRRRISYYNSDEYINLRKKMLIDAYDRKEREKRQKRCEQMDRFQALNKKNALQEFKENAMDIIYFVFGLLTTPIIMMYDDIKNEFLGNK